MCRAHRVIVSATVIAWVGALVLMWVPFIVEGDVRTALIIAAVNMGALAACLTTVSVMPYLLKDMFERSVTDYMGAYLAGWAYRGEQGQPTEPRRLSSVR